MLVQRQNLLENIFPAQWKTEFQSYFPQKLLESARTKKKKKKKKKNIYIKSFLSNGCDIKIQKGTVPAVCINKTLLILFVLFILFYLTTI